MEKQKRWHFYLITAVILLTIYNILPTVFFYTKPLKKPVNQEMATKVGKSSLERINSLEKESLSWINSYCSLLEITPQLVELEKDNPQLVQVTLKSIKDAKTFRESFNRSGSLISFAPAQLGLAPIEGAEESKTVAVQRKIPVHFNTSQSNTFFRFSNKFENNGTITPLYKDVLNDRLALLALSIGGVSENANLVDAIINTKDHETKKDLILNLSRTLSTYSKSFKEHPRLQKAFYASLTQGHFSNKSAIISSLTENVQKLNDSTRLARINLEEKQKKLSESNEYLENEEQQRLATLKEREALLDFSSSLLKTHASSFAAGKTPTSLNILLEKLNSFNYKANTFENLDLNLNNPVVQSISLDLTERKLILNIRKDLLDIAEKALSAGNRDIKKEQIEQIIYNEIARISRVSTEEFIPSLGHYQASLSALSNSDSFLAFSLKEVANQEASQLKKLIKDSWSPKSADLSKENFPIWDLNTYEKLPASQKRLGLLVYAPTSETSLQIQGLKTGSVYVIAKGIDQIIKKFRADPSSVQASQFMKDFQSLRELLTNKGYYGYPGATYSLSQSLSNDFIFENQGYFNNILKATREDFKVRGTKKFAVLEFSDFAQRILAENQIGNSIHEDLLKWRDEYNTAQVDPTLKTKFDIPKPTKNALLNNFALSFKKYFRGDERKIIKWGLDLSGGKTVQLELRDNNNNKVTNEADLTQGVDELYQRVNKMGVSEVSIRREGSNITLDFPGAQGLSASELVKASSMSFHVVNEKYSQNNPDLSDAVATFLQDVWNEALVTNKKDVESINRIAWNHLYGDSLDTDNAQPRSPAAKTLFENGLRLASSNDGSYNVFDESYSKIAMFRGDSFANWQGQSNPLLIIFNNYALEGSNLDDIHASYDPTKGNFLGFGVKSSQTLRNKQKINPRADFYAWTSAFSKEKIAGTSAEKYSRGRGWRMAVVLNGSVISAPALESALKDKAMITGSFTQREINKLEADLKAGSLTFSPKILSEKNVSPELGIKERHQGVLATTLALLLVIGTMVGYYRFAGAVASVAVIFNLLIMWATLQNIHAALTLAGIAGIILTVGMAVDANVLVFERIREEFAKSGRLSLAINAGYKRAFSAIFDSNITTIIAAVVLLQFDSGPIKAFAVMLIIGIVSSMFSALFMTKFFFQRWVKGSKNKSLKMAEIFKLSGFNFLKFGKLAISLSLLVGIVGSSIMIYERNSIFGMDFTGGFALNLEIKNTPQDLSYRNVVERALEQKGLAKQDFQVRELSPSNLVRIFLSKSLNRQGQPFHGMPLETSEPALYGYESNPRIAWVIDALQSQDIQFTQKSLQQADSSWTSISGQISDSMRNNALIGLAIALGCILLYITLRFELKYALCATLGLAHDVLVTIATLAILHALKIPVQIDLNTIAALLTIVGYSLNDTIIIFDRIREDVKTGKKMSYKDLLNTALNKTFSRTMMTSLTTVFVLVALVAFGGSTIFGFALVMTIGVVYGTLSSLFVATPLLYFLHNREMKSSKHLPYENQGTTKKL